MYQLLERNQDNQGDLMIKDPFQGPSEEDMELRGLDLKGNKLVFCPYCKERAEWVPNEEVYGRNIGKSHMIWLCRPCDAYVGCHKNTRNPLGTLADKKTRIWRQVAHSVFDPLWKSGNLSRYEAYMLLNKKLGEKMHIGKADVAKCKRIIHICTTDEKISKILNWRKC